MQWTCWNSIQPIRMCRLCHVISTLVFTASLLAHRALGSQTFRTQPDNATGIRGQTILLRCEVDGLIGQVTWMRDGFGLGADRTLSGFPRYRFDGAEELGEYTLMISNLQLEDDNLFQCQIMATGTTVGMASRKARVTVYLPPDQPTIEGEPTVEVVAGEPYNLSCNAINGKPAPSLTWYRDSQPVVSNDTYYMAEYQSDNKRQNATSLLTITPRKSDQGKRYDCEAKNEGTYGRLKTSVSLEVLYPPEVSMLVSPRHDRVKEGTSVTFSCSATGNPNVMAWKWIREQQELIGQTSSVLVQRVDRDWHGSRVECEATNKVTSTRQSVSLNVEYAPRFTAGAEHVPADVGDDAILNCAVDGNPTPTIIWSRKDSPTILGSQKYLKLYGVTEKDFGIYVCKASILGFNEIEMHVHLLKKGPPKILSPVDQASRFGETGVVECLSMSVPKPTTILWYKNGQLLDFDELERYQVRAEELPDGRRSIVEIISVQGADYGQYNCTVENGYGDDTISINFTQKEVVPLEYIVAGVLVGVFIIILIAVVLVIYRRRKSSSSESGSEASGDSLDKKDSGIPYKDPWATTDPYDHHRENIYGSHYGGVGPGYARSDYGTYPGPARNHIYEPSRYGSQSVYGAPPALSDYGVYGTYGRNPPPPRSDFIPASELGRPSTAMSNRLSTNV